MALSVSDIRCLEVWCDKEGCSENFKTYHEVRRNSIVVAKAKGWREVFGKWYCPAHTEKGESDVTSK